MTKKPKTRRLKLTLEYDGSRYSGWQRQKDAKTIQGCLLTASMEIFGGVPVDIQGNGRTDAGVHALHYVAHLETETDIPPDIIRMRFNDLLAADISLLSVEPCHPRFHARHSCVGRSYIYQISNRKMAFAKKYVWWIKDRLDLNEMAHAAQLFVGMHDFASFADQQEEKKSTKVLINAVQLHEADDLIVVRIVGSHFLWKMIRRVVGVLVQVGRKKLSRSNIEEFLLQPSREPARLTAPPSGLFFENAFYDEKEFLAFLAK